MSSQTELSEFVSFSEGRRICGARTACTDGPCKRPALVGARWCEKHLGRDD